jgi:hypothetical protein
MERFGAAAARLPVGAVGRKIGHHLDVGGWPQLRVSGQRMPEGPEPPLDLTADFPHPLHSRIGTFRPRGVRDETIHLIA